MTLLAIDWTGVAVKAGQFILSFSILVVLHELGHFIPARLFKVRVEKFYLFFDAWFSLFKKKIGDTEYGIGWIPFGGYVKISGMIDESMDKEQMKLPPKPYEFRSKKAWQRLIIMVGGVVVNILLAIVIFIGITYKWGDTYTPMENLTYGVYADSLATKIGVQDGDKIVAVNGKRIEKIGTVGIEIAKSLAKDITVERDGKEINLPIPSGFIEKLTDNKFGGFTYVRYPLIVDSLLPKAKVVSGNIHIGDTLIGLNGIPVKYSSDLLHAQMPENKNVNLKFLRGKDTVNATVFFADKGDYNISFKSYPDVLGSKHIEYSFAESIPKGFNRTWETLANYVQQLKNLFTSKEMKVNKNLGGIISIGNTFPGVWDWQSFWTLTGIFSIILAFMNILPIPALDGGHALFTIIEMITGRKPSDKFMEYAQMVGMILLLGLMAYALGLDVLRIFK
ncbi:RIP metalloprotease RseP [Chitinophagaceae bacterium LWZ2-11]